jgi:hypothetical protein
LFLVLWSIGGNIVQTTVVRDRDRFDKFLKALAGLGTSPNEPLPPNQLPADLLYEYCFETTELQWRSWKALVPIYVVSILYMSSFWFTYKYRCQRCVARHAKVIPLLKICIPKNENYLWDLLSGVGSQRLFCI